MRSEGVESGELSPSSHASMVDSRSMTRDVLAAGLGLEMPGLNSSLAVMYEPRSGRGVVGVLHPDDHDWVRLRVDMLTRSSIRGGEMCKGKWDGQEVVQRKAVAKVTESHLTHRKGKRPLQSLPNRGGTSAAGWRHTTVKRSVLRTRKERGTPVSPFGVFGQTKRLPTLMAARGGLPWSVWRGKALVEN